MGQQRGGGWGGRTGRHVAFFCDCRASGLTFEFRGSAKEFRVSPIFPLLGSDWH